MRLRDELQQKTIKIKDSNDNGIHNSLDRMNIFSYKKNTYKYLSKKERVSTLSKCTMGYDEKNKGP